MTVEIPRIACHFEVKCDIWTARVGVGSSSGHFHRMVTGNKEKPTQHSQLVWKCCDAEGNQNCVSNSRSSARSKQYFPRTVLLFWAISTPLANISENSVHPACNTWYDVRWSHRLPRFGDDWRRNFVTCSTRTVAHRPWKKNNVSQKTICLSCICLTSVRLYPAQVRRKFHGFTIFFR